MTATAIDLARLPAPTVVEVIDFETLYAERKAALIALYPAAQQAEVAATLELESEPLAILLQENTFREVLLRQRINDSSRAVMPAYSTGSDLDNLAALHNVERLTITPADPDNDIQAVMEEDPDLLKRFQLAPEGFSVAGPEGAYIFYALKADARVLDAAVKSPAPCQVVVTVLGRDGAGTAPPDLLAAVAATLNDKDTRPLTDQVTVQSASIVTYQVAATLYTFPGPDSSVVLAQARAQIDAYVAECHRIGRQVVVSGIMAALHVAGIERVDLAQPVANITTGDTQAPYCTAITINYGGVYG